MRCPKCNFELGSDVTMRAWTTVADVMDGKGGRGAMSRLSAAKMVLDKDYLAHMSDEDLLAEVKRRADAAKPTGSGGTAGGKQNEAKAKD